MRYQERIYIQNNNSSVRNSEVNPVNTSSDICIFNDPTYYLIGADKIDCGVTLTTGSTNVYIITTATTIPLTFVFTGNTDTFSADSTTFKYDIYKYDDETNIFRVPSLYTTPYVGYSVLSASTAYTQNIPISGISLDGDYLVKSYYQTDVCTLFLKELGKKLDTANYKIGSSYQLYNPDTDYYFVAIKEAAKPQLTSVSTPTRQPNGSLRQQVIIPDVGSTVFNTDYNYAGSLIVTLNGLVLAENEDYTVSNQVTEVEDGVTTSVLITLSGATETDDILTFIYTTVNANNIKSDTITAPDPIVSGITNNQGNNRAYYNTTTLKYEVYTELISVGGSEVIIILNGVVLTNNIDYYRSTTNENRIILNGELLPYDIITMVYFPDTTYFGDLTDKELIIGALLDPTPEKSNGILTLEVSNDTNFGSVLYSGTTNYNAGQSLYTLNTTISGDLGDVLYYRVKNTKNYATLCDDIITTINYSETVKIKIASNSINSY